MKTLILIRGVSGSGKSTLAKKLLTQLLYPAAHLETDFFFCDATTGKYNFDASKLAEHHASCIRETSRLMTLGGTVVVSNTFTRQWELHKYLLLAEVFDYEVVVHTCTGNYKNTHGVPQEVIDRQKANLACIDDFEFEYPGVRFGRHLFEIAKGLVTEDTDNGLEAFDPLDYLTTEEACVAYLKSAEDSGDEVFIADSKIVVDLARAKI